MICLSKERSYIHDYLYLVFPFHFQLCKIIRAAAKCAVKISFSYQKNKEDNSSLLFNQTFFPNKTDMFLLIIRSL